MKTQQVTLKRRPIGKIREGDLQLSQVELDTLTSTQVRVEQNLMSLDPTMFTWLGKNPDNYFPPVPIDSLIPSHGIATVVESNVNTMPVGTRVAGMFGWVSHSNQEPAGLTSIPEQVSDEAALTRYSLPAITAWFGLKQLSETNTGDFLVVNAAGGAVGSMVGQIAKLKGLQVIGITGNSTKKEWLMEQCNFDYVINYRTENLQQALEQYCKNGIDIYFDNVGGSTTDCVGKLMAPHSQIILCGLIADYLKDPDDSTLSKLPLLNMLNKRIQLHSFIMMDHLQQFPELLDELNQFVGVHELHANTHIIEGLAHAPLALNHFIDGSNRGKLCVKLTN